MKINSNLVLKGDRIALVPYLEEHVSIYNDWMKDPDLLSQTASEPLTLEEEYEMQRSWRLDEKKCTFIIIARENVGGKNCKTTHSFSHLGKMIGDCNLYFNISEEPHTAEIEIMIAEPCARRKGFAQETLSIFIDWAQEALNVTKLLAKISIQNHASLNLFQKKFRFQEVSRSEIFKEVTLESCTEGCLPEKSKIPWSSLVV
jgi:RimJ/RimL family protein N-acetyltransferase